ncbi:MAG TPA: response regulator [Candidatus Omnitrophota bacterium]|nr:response regulator [Candidatus Omnitrophota bacterium]
MRKLLKISDVLTKLKVSRRTVDYWVDNGILKAIRFGGTYRFHPEDIDQLSESIRETMESEHQKILVVGEDILMRHSIKSLLDRAGYSVTVVPDGDSALRLSQVQDFDLMLADMRMPEMNGVVTLKAIRKAQRCVKRDDTEDDC